MHFLRPEESQSWLKYHLEKSGITTLSNLADITGINKGTLSKYFRHLQRPTIDVVAVLSKAFKVKAEEILYGLGALEGDSSTFTATTTPNDSRE